MYEAIEFSSAIATVAIAATAIVPPLWRPSVSCRPERKCGSGWCPITESRTIFRGHGCRSPASVSKSIATNAKRSGHL